MADQKNVLLVGAGKMGLAMLKGWLAADIDEQFSFYVVEAHPSKDLMALRYQYDSTRLSVVMDVLDVCDVFDAIVLAIKPQQFATVLPHLSGLIGKGLVLSIAAGITTMALKHQLSLASIVRAMPNLPAQIGAGMCAGFTPEPLSHAHKNIAEFLLGATGEFKWVDEESQIDAVTAISGSGPAYVFLLAEALAQVAEKIGLGPRNIETFANQTIIGAAELLKQSEEGAATLRRNVTSPGGTTEAALKVLMREGNGLQELLLEAVQAAKTRSEELSK